MAAIETKLPGFYTSTMGETQSWEESWRPSGWVVVNGHICLLCLLRLSNVLYNLRCMTMATIHPRRQKPFIYILKMKMVLTCYYICFLQIWHCRAWAMQTWRLTPRWGTDTYPMHNDQLSYVLGRKGSTRQKLARASGTWDAPFWRVWHGSGYSNGLPVDLEDKYCNTWRILTKIIKQNLALSKLLAFASCRLSGLNVLWIFEFFCVLWFK